MNANWRRPIADLSSAFPVSALRLGPRARRRLQREGVLGAGAVAALIAAANASAHDGDAGLVIAEGDAADSLDDILSFAALCATGGAVAVDDHALHEGGLAAGHETHAFFDEAFASRLTSSLCGDDEGGGHAEHRSGAPAAHASHTDDRGAAQGASHAGHGEAHMAAHAAVSHGAAPHAAGGHGDEAYAGAHAGDSGAHADHGPSGHAVLAASAGEARHADHVPTHDAAALHALAAASDDDGDATPGLNALLGARDPDAAAPAQPPVQEAAAVYNPADHAAHDLPPAPVEV